MAEIDLKIQPVLFNNNVENADTTLRVVNLNELDDKIKETSKEYAKRVYEESAIREVAFLFENPVFNSIPIDICGVEVHQLTPYHFILLDFIRSPFLTNDNVPLELDVVDFLWTISPRFVVKDKEKKSIFVKEMGIKLDYVEAVKEIYDYLTKAFIDSPAQHVETNKIKKTTIPFYAWIAGYIDILANEYGFLDEYVMTMPFTRIFQFLKTIESRKMAEYGKDPLLFNQYSDRVMGELRKLTKEKSQYKNSVDAIREQLIREEQENGRFTI